MQKKNAHLGLNNMFKSKFTENAGLIQLEREMESFISLLLEDNEIDVDDARVVFLEQFEGEEHFFDNYVDNYFR